MEKLKVFITGGSTGIGLGLAQSYLKTGASVGICARDLAKIPAGLKERGWTLQQVIELIAWHEGHHHGQAHLTLNLFKAANGIT